jgi:hypothetical protein
MHVFQNWSWILHKMRRHSVGEEMKLSLCLSITQWRRMGEWNKTPLFSSISAPLGYSLYCLEEEYSVPPEDRNMIV